MYKGYLIDLDGVAYLGSKVIESCRSFINQLYENDIKFCFVTNNSSRTNKEVCEFLISLGYKVNEENIITSSEVTANYIKSENQDARVYMIGMNGLKSNLCNNNIKIVDDNADYVVIGLDLNLTYEKLAKACLEINKGAKFISTNSDVKLSTERGITPGNGSITKVIELSTDVLPLYMGKPAVTMLEYGLDKLELNKDEVAMIGDYYYTDILGAHNFGIDSIFVETGVMSIKDLEKLEVKPTKVVKELTELIKE